MRCRLSRKILHLSLLGLFSLAVLTLLRIENASAQSCVSGVACADDSDCGINANICDGTESCSGTCGFDVTFRCCVCGAAPPPLTPCGDDSIFCNGINVCDDTESCVPEDTLFQNPRCGANGECADFCDEATDTCADPVGTPCTDDGNFCTTDECNGAGACVSNPNDFQCDDNVNCTAGDVCSGGVCSGNPVQCDDSVSCTLDSCDEPTGLCQADASQCECQTDVDCDDGNVCTDEFCCTGRTCQAGELFTCVRSNNSAPCDDGLFCNGADTCAGGTCSVHTGDPCSGGGECDRTCNENDDNCFAPLGLTCDDGNILTIDQCDGGGACVVFDTLDAQGGSLGCALRPAGPRPFSWAFLWVWAPAGVFLFALRARRA